jgi:hypothetical protein
MRPTRLIVPLNALTGHAAYIKRTFNNTAISRATLPETCLKTADDITWKLPLSERVTLHRDLRDGLRDGANDRRVKMLQDAKQYCMIAANYAKRDALTDEHSDPPSRLVFNFLPVLLTFS